MRLSHTDVMLLGIARGLTITQAEDVAYEVCPEHRTCTEAKAKVAINKAVKS